MWFSYCYFKFIYLYLLIIEESTYDDLFNLVDIFPICHTNEMGIFNIYWVGIKKKWKPLDIFIKDKEGKDKILLDWSERDGRNWQNYVSLKYPNGVDDCN